MREEHGEIGGGGGAGERRSAKELGMGKKQEEEQAQGGGRKQIGKRGRQRDEMNKDQQKGRQNKRDCRLGCD